MKALSIRQPWCHAILHLGKRVENRDWSGCAYRGPVLLHASKTLVRREFHDAVQSIVEIINAKPGEEGALVSRFAHVEYPKRGMFAAEPRCCPVPDLPFGGIVGRARIVDAFDQRSSAPKDPRTWTAAMSPWYAGGFALVLADVEPLPFIPWKGSLGFFDVPDEIVEAAIADADQDRREARTLEREFLDDRSASC